MTAPLFSYPRCGVEALIQPAPDGGVLKPDGSAVDRGWDPWREWKRQGLTLTESGPALAAEAVRRRAIIGNAGCP